MLCFIVYSDAIPYIEDDCVSHIIARVFSSTYSNNVFILYILEDVNVLAHSLLVGASRVPHRLIRPCGNPYNVCG